mmetsp:Transcript_47995/g.146024  ORF Transcript_47995/g.146024 Transcript_47995/m.146024 type:complete len:240 (-) Transcript_47995:233-952(-)
MDDLLLGLVDLLGPLRRHVPRPDLQGPHARELHRRHVDPAQPLVLPLHGDFRGGADPDHQPGHRRRPQPDQRDRPLPHLRGLGQQVPRRVQPDHRANLGMGGRGRRHDAPLQAVHGGRALRAPRVLRGRGVRDLHDVDHVGLHRVVLCHLVGLGFLCGRYPGGERRRGAPPHAEDLLGLHGGRCRGGAPAVGGRGQPKVRVECREGAADYPWVALHLLALLDVPGLADRVQGRGEAHAH